MTAKPRKRTAARKQADPKPPPDVDVDVEGPVTTPEGAPAGAGGTATDDGGRPLTDDGGRIIRLEDVTP